MRIWLSLALLLCVACSDDKPGAGPVGPGVPPNDSGTLPVDAGGDAAKAKRSSCVDKPGELPRPPNDGRLPCELLPPGLTL